MADKKYQVFISSTYTDLFEERRKALDILLMADCIPAGMEAFVATDNEQFEVIKKVIDLCDYYILIIGKRYGSVNPTTGLSYTEMEYDYAKSKDIPVLVFAMDDSVDLPDDKMELETDMIEKLRAFREKAMTNRLATIWKTPAELAGALAVSIMQAKTEIERPGWQRATDYDEASLRREIMELQKRNDEIFSELADAEKTIASFTHQSDVAFDNCEIPIEYHFYRQGLLMNREDVSKAIQLPEIFSVIATEMMGVSIVEDIVKNAIQTAFMNPDETCHLKDPQIIKRILNQLKALDLINSFWSKEKNVLFWRLTEKGRKVRDDMILIRNKSEE